MSSLSLSLFCKIDIFIEVEIDKCRAVCTLLPFLFSCLLFAFSLPLRDSADSTHVQTSGKCTAPLTKNRTRENMRSMGEKGNKDWRILPLFMYVYIVKEKFKKKKEKFGSQSIKALFRSFPSPMHIHTNLHSLPQSWQKELSFLNFFFHLRNCRKKSSHVRLFFYYCSICHSTIELYHNSKKETSK